MKKIKIDVEESLLEKTELFNENIYANMFFRSKLTSNVLEFDWLDKIEFACPYIDNIIRKPRLSLISESDVVKIEKAKKVGIESVKDLSKHTEYIDKIDPLTQDVQPSRILITRREETYSTYENRFAYTLIHNLSRFVEQMDRLLDDVKEKKDKVLEYSSSTSNGSEKIVMEMKMSTKKLVDEEQKENMEKELEEVRERLNRVGIYINGWFRSEFFQQLKKDRAIFVKNPIKKTNMILKNPNFQQAMKLWEFLYNYQGSEGGSADDIESQGDNVLKQVLNDSFLSAYYVLDSISTSKKEQKKKLAQYAVMMIKQQIQRIISLLANSGIEVTEEQLLELISEELRKEKDKKEVLSSDVKNKFKSAMDEYLEQAQDYL